MSLNTIEHATREFISFINEAGIFMDIDDLGNVPLNVYNLQEEIYEQQGVYRVLSLLTIAFIQLGIVVLEDGEVENYIEKSL